MTLQEDISEYQCLYIYMWKTYYFIEFLHPETAQEDFKNGWTCEWGETCQGLIDRKYRRHPRNHQILCN